MKQDRQDNDAPADAAAQSDPPGERLHGQGGVAAIVLTLTIGVLWGLNWPAVKVLLVEIGPWTLRAVGFTIAAALLFVIAAARGDRMAPRSEDRVRLALAGLFSVFGFNILTAFGQLVTDTSKAAIIAFTMPVWAALMSSAILKEPLTTRLAAALALGVAALGLLLAEDVAGVVAAPAGPLFMVGAALSWAFGTVLLKRAAPSLGPIARSAWLVGVSAPPAILLAFLFEPQGPPLAWRDVSVGAFAVLAFHIIGPLALCYAAWSVLVARLPVGVAALATLLIPVVGVVSAGVLIGEVVGPMRLAALVAVVAAVGVALSPRALLRR